MLKPWDVANAQVEEIISAELWDVANVQVEEILSAEALGCSQCTG